MKRLRGILLWTLLLCGLGAAAGDARADFRHMRMGARPRALGSAFVSLADDANAAYWNPAGLVRNTRTSLMLTRAWLYGVTDLYDDYVCAALPASHGVHAGLSWVRLGIKDIYSENTLNLAAAFAAPFLDNLAFGVTGKLFLLEAPGYEALNDPAFLGNDHDFSCDVGFIYDGGPGSKWSLGGVLYNLNAPELQLLSTTQDPDPVFREWALGGSYKFRDTLLLSLDARSRDGYWKQTVLHGGAEIWFFNALALRSGVDGGLVSMGVGLQDVHWQLDFALETNRQLGNIYMLSLTVRN